MILDSLTIGFSCSLICLVTDRICNILLNRAIGYFGARDDQIIRINNYEAVEVIKAIEAVEATEIIEAAEVLRPGKSKLRTSESFRHLNSALFLRFEKKKHWAIIMKYHIEF